MLRYRSMTIAIASLTLGMAMTTASDARIRRGEIVERERGYDQRGIQVYAGFGMQNYEVEDYDYQELDQLDDGGSFFLGVGLGLSRTVSIYLEGSASEHPTPLGDVMFGTGMVGVKIAPNPGYRHKWQPYGKLALGGMFLYEDDPYYGGFAHHHDDDNGYMGPAVGIALGVDHYLSSRTAIFGELGLTSGQLDTRVIEDEEYDLVDDIDVTSGRIQFGLRFRL